MESRANAVLILKKLGFIETARECKFLMLEGADYIFSLSDGRIVAVDNILARVVRVNGERI